MPVGSILRQPMATTAGSVSRRVYCPFSMRYPWVPSALPMTWPRLLIAMAPEYPAPAARASRHRRGRLGLAVRVGRHADDLAVVVDAAGAAAVAAERAEVPHPAAS
jgi:hypothetical protein